MAGANSSIGALEFQDVYFGYRKERSRVFVGLTWSLLPGKAVLLGPNGAGKSTLLGLGASLFRPQRGHVRLGRLDSQRGADLSQFRRLVGWMPQHTRAVPGLNAREQVAYAGWLKGLSRSEAWDSALVALDQVGLSQRSNAKSSTLSGGQLHRLGLAQVLVHNPAVMLLDEPTAGLDPEQRARFREILVSLPADRPIVVSTHQVDDLDELFQTVFVLSRGTFRFSGTVEEFMRLAPSGTIARQAERAYSMAIGGVD